MIFAYHNPKKKKVILCIIYAILKEGGFPMYEKLNHILNSLISGNLSVLNPDNIVAVSSEAVRIMEKTTPLDKYDVMNAGIIISISQIVYNNTDRTILFLEDGVYDLLLEKYRIYNSNFQVGAPIEIGRASCRERV